jgi:protein TonB
VEDVAPQRQTARSIYKRQVQEQEIARTRVLEAPLPSAMPAAEKPKELDVPPPPQIALNPAKLEKAPIPERAPEVPKVMASMERPGSSRFSEPLKKAFGWIPGVRSKKDYVPPKVVRQVQPRVTTPQDTSVAVRVSIDPKGIVRDADLLTKGVDGHLGRSAVEAAKRWRFEPARADDRPVASNMVLRFKFEGTRN